MIRHHALHATILLATVPAVILLVGCEPPTASSSTANGPPGPPSPPAAGSGETTETILHQDLSPNGNSESLDSAETLPVADPVPESPPSAPSQTAGVSIRLSAGVALPQLLPDGTQIGVSVDYSIRGNMQSSSRYLLIVASSAGEISVPVTLNEQGGTYQGFLPLDVRPEHKPFRARIDEVSPSGVRTPISNSADLVTSY